MKQIFSFFKKWFKESPLSSILGDVLNSGDANKNQEDKEAPTTPIPDIFHEYDIRGIYPDEVNAAVYAALASAFYEVFGPSRVVLGRDSRKSSLPLARALSKRFRELGVDIVDAGYLTTPQANWIARIQNEDVCMVTASHNPPQFNGLKLYSKAEGPIHHDNMLPAVQEAFKGYYIGDKTHIPKDKDEQGNLGQHDYTGAYQKALLSCAGKIRGRPHIVVDYSNGTTAQVANGVLEELGVRFTTLNEDPNGDFPVHGPNPLDPRSHEKIAWLVSRENYDMGVLFDGDGDRVAFFDETGAYVPPAQMGALLADYLFPRVDHFRSVVATEAFSRAIEAVAEKHEGRVHRSPVGRTEVTPLMKQKRSFLAVERSGHYFFKDFGYQDSAVLAMVKALEAVTAQPKKTFSEVVAPFKRYTTLPEINIPRNGTEEERVFTAVRRAFPRGEVREIDGLTIMYEKWWFNLRASNTEDVWRLSIEGVNPELVEEKRAELEAIIRAI